MLDTNFGGQIIYKDLYPAAYDPATSYVVSLKLPSGELVDFSDTSTYYNVSTVNYLAAGSCNFNNGGVSLWPLNQIVHDTQYYVRDAVINHVKAEGTVSPAIEGRLVFLNAAGPAITVTSPEAKAYPHPAFLTLDFDAVATAPASLAGLWPYLDGAPVTDGQVVDLLGLSLGDHTLTVYAVDSTSSGSFKSVTFSVTATVSSLVASVNRFYAEGKITKANVRDSLLDKLYAAQESIADGNEKAAINQLNSFINLVKAQSGKAITNAAADFLIADAMHVIATLR
jgi:hypothetical protein